MIINSVVFSLKCCRGGKGVVAEDLVVAVLSNA